MERKEVYNAINSERFYQDRKYGLAMEGANLEQILKSMFDYSERLKDKYDSEDLRKLLALGVALAELYGINERSWTQPVTRIEIE